MTTQTMNAANHVENSVTNTPKWPRHARLGARLLLLVWGGFWAWFISMNIISDGPPSYPYALPLLVGVLAAALVPWKWVRMGGLLAIAFGAFAFWRFQDARPEVLAAVAGIPVLAGLVLMVVGPRRA